MRLTDEENAMLAGEQGPVRQWAMAHQVAVGEFFDAPDTGAGRPGPHHGRHREPGRGRRRLARAAGGQAGGPAARARPHHHRPARARSRLLQAPQADRRHGRHRDARLPRARGAGRADDEHLHQLPDHPAARARRAPGARRHRGRHLFQQRDGRAQQLRGRAFGAGRRAHRPHAALRLPSRCRTAPAPAISQSRSSPATSPTGARSAASSAAPPTATGRCRSSRGSQPCAGLRRAQALRRGAGELRLGGHVPHARRDARGGDTARSLPRRRRAAGADASARPISRRSMQPMRRPATRSTWWCSPPPSSP